MIGRAAKQLDPNWLSTPFLHLAGYSFCAQQQEFFQVLGFKFLRWVVCVKSTWKSSAAAVKEIPKGEFLCIIRNSKTLFVSKAKVLDRICLIVKLKSVVATKCFHLNSLSNEG